MVHVFDLEMLMFDSLVIPTELRCRVTICRPYCLGDGSWNAQTLDDIEIEESPGRWIAIHERLTRYGDEAVILRSFERAFRRSLGQDTLDRWNEMGCQQMETGREFWAA